MNERLIKSEGVSRNSSSLNTSTCLRYLVLSKCTLLVDLCRWFHSVASVCLLEPRVQTSIFCRSPPPCISVTLNWPPTLRMWDPTDGQSAARSAQHFRGAAAGNKNCLRENNVASDTREGRSKKVDPNGDTSAIATIPLKCFRCFDWSQNRKSWDTAGFWQGKQVVHAEIDDTHCYCRWNKTITKTGFFPNGLLWMVTHSCRVIWQWQRFGDKLRWNQTATQMLDVTNPLFILARTLPPSLYPHKRNKLCILSQVNWFSLWFGVPKQTQSDWKCRLRRAGNLTYVIRLEKHELAGLSFKVITELGGHVIQSCQLEHVKPDSIFFQRTFFKLTAET